MNADQPGGDVVSTLTVTIEFDLIRPLYPEHDEETLRTFFEQNSRTVALYMVSAGVQAAVNLISADLRKS